MAGGTPREAVANFLAPIQRVISCVSDGVILHLDSYDLDRDYAWSLRGGDDSDTVTLHGGQLAVSLRHRYRIVRWDEPDERGPFKVTTTAYMYRLVETATMNEILSYQYHPDGPSPYRRPHINFGAAANVGHQDLRKAHVPTRRIAVEDVIFLAVALGAKAREGFEDELQEAREGFEQFGTWA